MSNWRLENNEPMGMIRHDELLHILKALALTDCDNRTLGIVAEATGLGKYWPKPVRIAVEPVYLIEQSS